MGYNHRKEEWLFEALWKKQAEKYIEAGMSSNQVAAMREFDREIFQQERRRREHLAEKLPDNFWQKRAEVTTEDAYFLNMEKHLDFVLDEICPGLSRLLTDRDKDIILLTYCGETQQEIAERIGSTQSTVSRSLKKVKNILEKCA